MVDLLPEHRQPDAVVQDDIVALRMRAPETVDTLRTQPTLGLDLLQKLLGVAEELARRGAMRWALEDRRELPLQLPRMEEEGPVDVQTELRQRWLDHAHAGER